MKKFLSLTILLSTYIFAQWDIVVIDSGSHSPGSNVTFQPGVISLAVDKNNKVHIAYEGIYGFESNIILDSVLQYVKYNPSTSNKEADVIAAGLIDGLGPNYGISPSVVIDNNNAIYLVHFYQGSNGNPIEILYSLDGSTFSWKLSTAYDFYKEFVHACIDKNNVLHILYYNTESSNFEEDYHLRYAKYSSNSGWQEVASLYYPNYSPTHLSVGVDSQGILHFTYFIGTETPTVYYGFYDGTKISTETVDIGELPTLGIDKDNNIHICYLSSATFTVYGQQLEYSALVYKKKTQQGWTDKQIIAACSGNLSYTCNKIVFDNNGGLHLVCVGILEFDMIPPIPDYSGLICVSKLTPSATWQAEVIEKSDTQNIQQIKLFLNPVIDIDTNGQIHVCYERRTTIFSGTEYQVYDEVVYAKRSPMTPGGGTGENGSGTGESGDTGEGSDGTASQEDVVKPAKIHFTPASAVRKKIDELKKKLQQ
ncbi:MAG: hypothetical protein QXG39_07945 [Candidatus Aenigmatarchaeota archaeon]